MVVFESIYPALFGKCIQGLVSQLMICECSVDSVEFPGQMEILKQDNYDYRYEFFSFCMIFAAFVCYVTNFNSLNPLYFMLEFLFFNLARFVSMLNCICDCE